MIFLYFQCVILLKIIQSVQDEIRECENVISLWYCYYYLKILRSNISWLRFIYTLRSERQYCRTIIEENMRSVKTLSHFQGEILLKLKVKLCILSTICKQLLQFLRSPCCSVSSFNTIYNYYILHKCLSCF